MTRPARARIDLQALRHNFSRVRQAAPNSRTMAIIKANAYGHGTVEVARALPDASAFGVACMEEAIALREAGFDRRIVLLEGLFAADDIALINAYRLDVVVHHHSQVDLLERGRLIRPVSVWLKVDTGMNRLGFMPDSIAAARTRLAGIAGVGEVRLMTHFACADDLSSDYTRKQLQRFNAVVAQLPGECSLANSAGVLGWPDTHADWVRPGVMLYGSSPLLGRSAGELDLRPVMTLTTRLIAVNSHRQGDRVGYSGDWICASDTNIGVAAIGYADGYPRHAPSGMPVLVNGKRVPLAGRVSMDMICLDLGTQPLAQVGDEVILWGDGLPIDEVATLASTISYELFCGVGRRVQFDYLD
jgi:alanine racemase